MAVPSPRTTVGRALLLAALLAAAVLLALAWRAGLPDWQCGCSCARDGSELPPEVWRARVRAFDDRGGLLIGALVAAAVAVADATVGVAVASGRRAGYAVGLVAGVALGIGALVSIFPLVPCLGE
jgi:hypothetical protein